MRITLKISRTACALILLILIISGARATPTIWKPLKPGLEYTLLQPGYGRLYAFRIDPAKYDLDLATAADLDHPETGGLTVEEIAEQTQALVAVNGGFFTPNYQPLGLRIQNGQLRSPFKPISWWGVFYLKNHPEIVSSKAFKDLQNITFAIQAGPRLVVQGEIPHLKSGADDRSAICLTQQQQVILVVSQGASLTLSNFANILQKPEQFGGLNCYNALNLDGGHSSQLFAKIGPNELSVPNLSPVADAVIVKSRDNEKYDAHNEQTQSQR